VFRGETKLDPEIESQLRCRYVHKDDPYLRLGPVKEEEASLSPRIVVYHDVIHDSEIATVRRIAQPRV
jgi:prolyl 4-hydroxylase